MNGLNPRVSQALEAAARSFQAGDLAAAVAGYRSAVAQAPQLAEAHFNLAVALRAQNEIALALASFEEAARCRPGWISPLLQAGILCFVQGHFEPAQAYFERALAIDASDLAANFNLGKTLIAMRRWRLAVPYLQRAREASPANEAVWLTLRDTLHLIGRREEALEDFLRFEQSATASAWTIAAGLASCRLLGDAEREASALGALRAWHWQAGEGAALAQILAMLQYFDLPREEIAGFYRAYDRLLRPLATRLAGSERRPGARWRVGYVSADFRHHVMGLLLRRVMERHDRSRFEIHLYSLAPQANEDEVTRQFITDVDGFHRLNELDDHAAASLIASHDIDLLVDLMGHTGFCRPGIYVRKPARVQLTHLGYHGALGLSEIDFKLTDAIADLPDCGRYQLEAPLPMTVCLMPFDHHAPAPLEAAADANEREQLVFAVFVKAMKLSPRCLEVWRRLLAAEPRAQLAFSPLEDPSRRAIERRLTEFGISLDRVRFIPPGRTQAEQRARYRHVDVVLDTFPYSGGDTTMAALDMAVPVVTLTGLRQSERMSLSILTHLGVTETVARNEDEYLAIALRLAREPEWRRAVSRRIAERLPASGMADPSRYTRALEEAYLEALRRKGFCRAEQSLPE